MWGSQWECYTAAVLNNRLHCHVVGDICGGSSPSPSPSPAPPAPLLLPTFGVLLRFVGYLWYTYSARSIVLSWCSGLLWDLWVVHGVFDVGYGSVAGTNYCELMNL